MIAYIDTSVVLRIILDQPDPLVEWDDLELGVSNQMLHVECFRTLDRYWHQGELTELHLENKRHDVQEILTRLELIPIDQSVLSVAARPYPTTVRTLDAIHLASAILYRDKQPSSERPITFATHDKSLARAARAMHFEVIGV